MTEKVETANLEVVKEMKVENFPEKGTVTHFAQWSDGKATAQTVSEEKGASLATPIEKMFEETPRIDWEKREVTWKGKVRHGEFGPREAINIPKQRGRFGNGLPME